MASSEPSTSSTTTTTSAATASNKVVTESSTNTSVHVKPYDSASDALPTARQQAEMKQQRHDDSTFLDRDQDNDEDDEDAAALEELERELDDDFDLGGFRERRMEELKGQMEELQKMKQSDYGKYNEWRNEKQVIQATAKASRSLVHFFHRDFRRCKIMDSHLEKLARKHLDTLFIKIDVANAPFLVAKMDVKVLPCVVGFVGAVSKLKIVGFEELPGGDNFTTSSLEFGLIQADVIKDPAKVQPRQLATNASSTFRRGIRSGGAQNEAGADDDDLDY